MKFIYYTLLIGFLLLNVYCDKDFLQRDPGVAITETNVFTDPVLATRFADNTYNFLLDE